MFRQVLRTILALVREVAGNNDKKPMLKKHQQQSNINVNAGRTLIRNKNRKCDLYMDPKKKKQILYCILRYGSFKAQFTNPDRKKIKIKKPKWLCLGHSIPVGVVLFSSISHQIEGQSPEERNQTSKKSNLNCVNKR